MFAFNQIMFLEIGERKCCTAIIAITESIVKAYCFFFFFRAQCTHTLLIIMLTKMRIMFMNLQLDGLHVFKENISLYMCV